MAYESPAANKNSTSGMQHVICKGLFLLAAAKVTNVIIRDTFVYYKDAKAGKYTKGEGLVRLASGIILSITGTGFFRNFTDEKNSLKPSKNEGFDFRHGDVWPRALAA